MDYAKAQLIESYLINKQFGDYIILGYINNGKSAAVFKAKDINENLFAIKIFDEDLIKRFGQEIQLQRIRQEIELKDHKIHGLVKIVDGGEISINSKPHYYLVMEYVQGKNLKEFISSEEYDVNFLLLVLRLLVNVTEQLLSKDIVHRDIKPENIMVDSEGNIILMDLGVLKIIGSKSFSDLEEKQFLGTLRYAPPEFLTRQEEDTTDGWRSVNLYQIGTVLYELIEKKELFQGESPYTNLVLAIKEKNPVINSRAVPSSLIQLTRNMLTKNWKLRLTLNPVDKILELVDNTVSEMDNSSLIDRELEQFNIGNIDHEEELDQISAIRENFERRLEVKRKILKEIFAILNVSVASLKNKGLIVRWRTSGTFFIYIHSNEVEQPHYAIFELHGLLKKGFSRPLYLIFKIVNDENSYCEIGIAAAILGKKVNVNLEAPGVFLIERSAQW